jgi:uncharacterized protein (DUF433 family)
VVVLAGTASAKPEIAISENMFNLPPSEFIEPQNKGYRLAGTRISLDSIAYGVLRGQSVDEILADFPTITSRSILAGAVAYIKDHPKEIRSYLEEGEREWDEATKRNPPHMVEKIRRYEERKRKPA